jgi:predicted amino acid racemase
METVMSNTIFDFNAFAKITDQLMLKSPDRARALMVENNAYYMLVNMHIQLCNMVEFADIHDSQLESLIDDLKAEVERIQELKGSRWLDDFIGTHRDQ